MMAGASSIDALPPALTIQVFSGPNWPLVSAVQARKRAENARRVLNSFMTAKKVQLTLR